MSSVSSSSSFYFCQGGGGLPYVCVRSVYRHLIFHGSRPPDKSRAPSSNPPLHCVTCKLHLLPFSFDCWPRFSSDCASWNGNHRKRRVGDDSQVHQSITETSYIGPQKKFRFSSPDGVASLPQKKNICVQDGNVDVYHLYCSSTIHRVVSPYVVVVVAPPIYEASRYRFPFETGNN